MRIPKIKNLVHQSFNHKKVEFVWRFDNNQFICGISKDGSVYLETGQINEDGEYIKEPEYKTFSSTEMNNTPAPVWTLGEYPVDLIYLVKDVVEYLKSL